MRAARAVRVGILEARPELDLELLVVWVSVFPADGEGALRRAAEILPDPRVRHFADASRRAGRALAASIGMPAPRDVVGSWGSTREELLRVYLADYLDGPATAFDAILFYGGDAAWGAAPPAPAQWVTAMDPEAYTGLDRSRFFWGEALVTELRRLSALELGPAAPANGR